MDRALDSPRFVEPLRIAQIRIGHLTGFLEIYAHNDLFAPDTPDEIWIRHCGQNGWIAFTKDRAIRYRQLEKQTVQAYNARFFNLATRKNMTAGENAQAYQGDSANCTVRKATRSPFYCQGLSGQQGRNGYRSVKVRRRGSIVRNCAYFWVTFLMF